jgi:ABC-2 type transport system permease protein
LGDRPRRRTPIAAAAIEPLTTGLAALRAHLAVHLAVQLQYRAWLLIGLVYFVLKPLILLSVWTAVAGDAGGSIGGYAPEDLAAYFLTTMWLIHLTFMYLLEVEGRVRRGEYSRLLVRPLHPILGDLAANLAYKALTAPVLALATLVLVYAFEPRIDPPSWAVAAFVPALLLAFVLRFTNEWTVSLAAFWLTRMQAVVYGYLLLVSYLGGEIAPLALLPEWVQALAWLSPFRWMLAFPAELLLGRLTPRDAAIGLGMQLLWAAISLLLLRLCWRAAARRYTAVGG